MSGCSSIFSTSVHPMDFTLGGRVAEEPRKCSVRCEAAWISASRQSYNNPSCTGHATVFDGRYTSVYKGKTNGSGSLRETETLVVDTLFYSAPPPFLAQTMVFCYSGFDFHSTLDNTLTQTEQNQNSHTETHIHMENVPPNKYGV